MKNFYFEGIKRLDWGFSNPNITAGLIAILMVAIWILPRIHRWAFWPTLLGFGGLGVCLIQTVSRGGVLAALAGGISLIFLTKRPWDRRSIGPIAAIVLMLIGYSIWHGSAGRYSQGIAEEDRSISNRWMIYSRVPAMIVDAPEGWGVNRAHEAFHNFYLPTKRIERYRNLVSSHFTWLAEFGWFGRIAYLFGWLTALFLGWPSARKNWYCVVFSVWITFGLAATFTTMANRWVLWIVPGLLFLSVLIERARSSDWPRMRRWGVPIGLTIAIVVIALIFGSFVKPSSPPLQLSRGFVSFKSDDSNQLSYWMIDSDITVVGAAFGMQIREKLMSSEKPNPCIFINWREGELSPEKNDVVILSGKGIESMDDNRILNLAKASKWLLLNPETPSSELLEHLVNGPSIHIYWGEFNSGDSRMLWQAIAKEHDHITFDTVRAAGVFLPDWIDLVIGNSIMNGEF